MSLSAQSNSEYFSAISEMYWRLVIFKYFIIESSNGNSEEVAPNSAPILVIVALPVQLMDFVPGPKYSIIEFVPPETVRIEVR